MTLPLFVSNSSPIIAFEHLDLLDLLPAIKPSLDTLMESDFRISKDLYRLALQSSGEWAEPHI